MFKVAFCNVILFVAFLIQLMRCKSLAEFQMENSCLAYSSQENLDLKKVIITAI